MRWASLLHIYQPPGQDPAIIRKVCRESYERILDILERNRTAKLTLNINAVLCEQLVRIGKRSILERIRRLASSGRLELTGSAKYHVILPLLPEREIVRQVQENERTNRRFFGRTYRPSGFFLPELCYSNRVARTIERLGYEWIVLDEVAFNGRFGDRRLRFGLPYRVAGTKRLEVFFRSRRVSDLFFTTGINRTADFFATIRRWYRPQPKTLVTACDGENFGHHRPGLDRVLAGLLRHPRIESVTYAELRGEPDGAIRPRPSSWASWPEEVKTGVPYLLWQNPKNAIHRLQWRLTHSVLRAFDGRRPPAQARRTLDAALHSDQYWWASAAPWFGVEQIDEGAKLLVRALEQLPAPKSTVSRARLLREHIVSLARQWLKSGYAASMGRAYLAREPFTRVFGGSIVKKK